MADPSLPEGQDRDVLYERLRDDLLVEQGHLAGQLSEMGEDGEGRGFDENFADSGQVAAEQGEYRALAGQLRDQLDDVQSALSRLEDGTYGLCEVCGEPIGEARLEAMPATRWCINHAG